MLVAIAVLAAILAVPAPAPAQGRYPSRPIEVVVPFAQENKWSPVPINVVNRAGGSGVVGYTYLIGTKGDPQ